ncbi:LLM class flavin-dependent oxidoreductase [Streptomyces sp. LZ34]
MTVVELNDATAQAALERAGVDAWVATEPSLLALEAIRPVRVLAQVGDHHTNRSVIWGLRRSVELAPEQVGAVLTALDASDRRIAENPQAAGKIKQLREQAAAHGRTDLKFGVRLYVVVRDTEEEAWRAAGDLYDHMDADSVARTQQSVAGSDSAGQARMTALHGGRKPADLRELEIYPNLWSGIGLVRNGPGTAIVGSPAQVVERINDYRDAGVDTFIVRHAAAGGGVPLRRTGPAPSARRPRPPRRSGREPHRPRHLELLDERMEQVKLRHLDRTRGLRATARARHAVRARLAVPALFATLALSLTAACSPAPSSASSDSESRTGLASPGTLRIGPLATLNLLTLSRQDGSLEKKIKATGGGVTWSSPFPAFAPAAEAIGAGKIDLTSGSTTSLVTALAANPDLVAFAVEKNDNDTQGIVAAPGKGISRIKDLVGRSVAVNKGGTGEYLLLKALAHEGIPAGKVKRVYLQPADAATAFAAGHVDAWATWDQFLASARTTPGSKVLALAKDVGAVNRTIHVVSRSFLTAHPDEVKAAYRALKDGAPGGGSSSSSPGSTSGSGPSGS